MKAAYLVVMWAGDWAAARDGCWAARTGAQWGGEKAVPRAAGTGRPRVGLWAVTRDGKLAVTSVSAWAAAWAAMTDRRWV